MANRGPNHSLLISSREPFSKTSLCLSIHGSDHIFPVAQGKVVDIDPMTHEELHLGTWLIQVEVRGGWGG